MPADAKSGSIRNANLAIAGFALACALAALLSDWLWSELFMRRDSVQNIAGALAINAALLVALIAIVKICLPAPAALNTMRALAMIVFVAVVLSGLRAAVSPDGAMGMGLRLVLSVAILIIALAIVTQVSDAVGNRLMQALAVASVAFIAVPFAWRLASPPPRVWIESPSALNASQGATILLLLDELGNDAAAPLVKELQDAGLNVRSESLAPAGKNTLNVIPALFSGLDFARARPCGVSTLCSGSNALDFSRITIKRPDVDVSGLLVPYCDIPGLRSCFQLPLPHEFGTAYRSLAVFYLRRLALPLPAMLKTSVEAPAQKRKLLKLQTDWIDGARLWSDGGILYAHLPIPHPPGLDGASDLDAEYAANIDQARLLLQGWIRRASARFGLNFSIVLTSDHPLRDYWCVAGVYQGAACSTRAAFRSTRVPLIVATPGAISKRAIASNQDVFRILNDQAGSARP